MSNFYLNFSSWLSSSVSLLTRIPLEGSWTVWDLQSQTCRPWWSSVAVLHTLSGLFCHQYTLGFCDKRNLVPACGIFSTLLLSKEYSFRSLSISQLLSSVVRKMRLVTLLWTFFSTLTYPIFWSVEHHSGEQYSNRGSTEVLYVINIQVYHEYWRLQIHPGFFFPFREDFLICSWDLPSRDINTPRFLVLVSYLC